MRQPSTSPFTDIFTPGVDFIEEFRFLGEVETLPVVGEVFTFVLLDLLCDPIPGTESTDVWNGCHQGAPQNVQGVATGEGIDLSWDAVPPVAGFNPAGGVGIYQIVSDGGYGGITDGTTEHLVPWSDFGGSSDDGYPDGFDFGLSLSEFGGDGIFGISVIAFAQDVGPRGVGTSCQVRAEEPLLFEILDGDGNITIPAP